MKEVEGQLMPLVQKAYQTSMPTEPVPEESTVPEEPSVDDLD